jgi:hypothetical protein
MNFSLLLFLLLSLKSLTPFAASLVVTLLSLLFRCQCTCVLQKCSLALMDESSDKVFIGIVGVPESGKSTVCIQHNKQQEAELQPGSNFLKQPYLECRTMCLTIMFSFWYLCLLHLSYYHAH